MRLLLLVLMLLGMAGWMHYLVNVRKISVFLAPSAFVTGVCAFMYVCGLVNIMPLGVYTVLISGILLGFLYRKDLSFAFLKGNLLPLFLCLCLVLYTAWQDYGQIYPDGDTMTHWGIIVREMFRCDRLPNFLNTVVKYQSYPPATACWIYFVQKIIGYGEARALFAQGFWIMVCAMAAFACNKKRNRLADLMIFVCSLYCINNAVSDLRVDVLLPASIAAAAISLYEYRDDPANQLLLGIPYMIAIPMIKNSGLLFTVFLLLLVLVLDGTERRRKLWNTGIFAFCTFGFWYLWQMHIKMVYEKPNSSRHSMSPGYMKHLFSERSGEEIRSIIVNFLKKWFSLNDSHEWQFILLFAVIVILTICLRKKETRKLLKLPVLMFLYYSMYKICLAGMYLFNMPGAEAANLPAYDRYQYTFSILMVYAILWYLCTYTLPAFEERSSGRQTGLLVPVLVTACVVLTIGPGALYRPNRTWSIHGKCLTILQNQTEGAFLGAKILDYNSYSLSFFFTEFTFENPDCETTYDIEMVRSALTENPDHYDFLMISTGDEQTAALLTEFGYPENASFIRLSAAE